MTFKLCISEVRICNWGVSSMNVRHNTWRREYGGKGWQQAGSFVFICPMEVQEEIIGVQNEIVQNSKDWSKL